MKEKKEIEFLPWDSGFFSARIGRIKADNKSELEDCLTQARAGKYDCLYFKTTFAEREILKFCFRRGFIPVDLKTTLTARLDIPPSPLPAPGISGQSREGYYQVCERLAVEELAPLSRFAFDPRFGPEAAGRLYRLWIRKTFAGEGGRSILFASTGTGEAAGFISFKEREGTAVIDLFAVGRNYRNQGIGHHLLQAGQNWARDKKYGELSVVTQGHNIPALRSYQQAGFITEQVNLFFHKWL